MCTCREDIERKLTERHIAKNPASRDHKVTLQGYGFALGASTVTVRGFMPFETFEYAPLKKGGEKPKKTAGNMYFTFCPFCGAKVGND